MWCPRADSGPHLGCLPTTPAAVWQRRKCQPGRGHESLARLYWSRDLRDIRKKKKITFVFPTFRYSPAFSLARLTLPTSSITSSLVPASSVVLSAYLRFVTILPPMLIPFSHSSKASLIMFSAYNIIQLLHIIYTALTHYLYLTRLPLCLNAVPPCVSRN